VSKIIYAIPAVNGKLSAHFGHSENFVIVETENSVITKEYSLNPPEHVPGASTSNRYFHSKWNYCNYGS